MATYPIPEYLQDSHDGDEWAVAAILEGRVVALLYLEDVAPQLMRHLHGPEWEFVVRRWVQLESEEIDSIQELGQLVIGVVQGDGLTERWQLPIHKPAQKGLV